MEIYLSGYPSSPGIRLGLQDLADNLTYPLKPLGDPGNTWTRLQFALPSSWRGKPFRLAAFDNSAARKGWIGFSEPLEGRDTVWGLNETAGLLWRIVLCVVLTGLPPFALAAFAIQRGVRDVTLTGLIALLGTAAVGYVSFWLWLLNPLLGHGWSLCLPVLSAAYLYFCLRAIPPVLRTLLRSLLFPMGLTVAAALLVLSTGFLYGGFESPMGTAATRFSHPLPPDNSIPYLFAEKVAHHEAAAGPLIGDWRSSDRPPLQTGIVLSEFAYFHGAEDYTVLATILQSTWIFALWLFLAALDIHETPVRLALAVCLFSGFIFINSFYVWPKLLAAAYMIGCLTIVVPGKFETSTGKSVLVSAIAGCLLAFAMLSHGGSMFAVLGAIVTRCILRKRIAVTNLAVIAAAAFALYLPWLGYQKLYDPPGDRLLKWHLAGVHDIDTRPFASVFVGAYENIGFHQFIANKEANVVTVIGHYGEYAASVVSLLDHLDSKDAQTLAVAAQQAWAARGFIFFFCTPNLGFLVLGLPAFFVAWLWRRGSTETRTAGMFWLLVWTIAAFWCLLMFSPNSTVIHQGTYVTIILAYSAAILALWAVRAWLAVAVSALQILLNIFLYVATMRLPVPNTYLPEGHLRVGMLIVCVLALAGVLVLLTRSQSGPASRA